LPADSGEGGDVRYQIAALSGADVKCKVVLRKLECVTL